MSWTPIDEWRERQAEERRDKEDALMGTSCLGCYYADKCDYAYAYETCELCEYDEQEESWERMD